MLTLEQWSEKSILYALRWWNVDECIVIFQCHACTGTANACCAMLGNYMQQLYWMGWVASSSSQSIIRHDACQELAHKILHATRYSDMVPTHTPTQLQTCKQVPLKYDTRLSDWTCNQQAIIFNCLACWFQTYNASGLYTPSTSAPMWAMHSSHAHKPHLVHRLLLGMHDAFQTQIIYWVPPAHSAVTYTSHNYTCTQPIIFNLPNARPVGCRSVTLLAYSLSFCTDWDKHTHTLLYLLYNCSLFQSSLDVCGTL